MASTIWATTADDPTGEAFVARTLELAHDPSAWPILVHCHASMDRSPAWMGLYRFVVQGWPLADALREIECHRGLRPKASVTLLYNRMLPKLAPERAAQDPTAALLRENAAGTVDPVTRLAVRPGSEAPQAGHGAEKRIEPATLRQNPAPPPARGSDLGVLAVSATSTSSD